MTTKSIASATTGQKRQLVHLVEEVGGGAIKDLGLTKDDAQRLLEKGGDFKSRLRRLLTPLVQEFAVAPNIMVVPDLSAVELTALTERDLKLTCLDVDYAKWDYYHDDTGRVIEERGVSFEVLIYKPELGLNEGISSATVRDYLRERGYTGHVGAFTQWRRQNPGLVGYHASIPEDGACWSNAHGGLFVPYSYFEDARRELDMRWIDDDWSDPWSFVGFHAI